MARFGSLEQRNRAQPGRCQAEDGGSELSKSQKATDCAGDPSDAAASASDVTISIETQESSIHI